MPRKAHKRGNDIKVKGLSTEKVCVPCAVSDTGISYSKPGKLGKISSECINRVLGKKIAPHATLCTDKERAYHSRLKTFIRGFHGVSTKHLGNYTVWNNLLSGNHRKTEEFIRQLWGQLLCARITRYWHDIPRRPSLPVSA